MKSLKCFFGFHDYELLAVQHKETEEFKEVSGSIPHREVLLERYIRAVCLRCGKKVDEIAEWEAARERIRVKTEERQTLARELTPAESSKG